MKFYYPPPHFSVAGHVRRILVIEDYQVRDSFNLPLFANGFPTLLFQTSKGTIQDKAANNLILFGQTVLPEMLTIKEGFTLIAYFFNPYAVSGLFGIPANELTNQPVDLCLTQIPNAAQLSDQLLHATTVEKRLQLINHFILKLANDYKGNDGAIVYAVNQLLKNISGNTLPALQKDLNISERTLQRMFERSIGISPNLFRRICQFNTAFEQLNNNRSLKLSDIAYSNGYADQSHYIRAFKEFTHIIPKEYLKFGADI